MLQRCLIVSDTAWHTMDTAQRRGACNSCEHGVLPAKSWPLPVWVHFLHPLLIGFWPAILHLADTWHSCCADLSCNGSVPCHFMQNFVESLS